ncbi:hypothetical protein Acsp01_14540 [Actinoplanes sp. NBRC 101535]|nr:hypothetical protein Acsp01_14540 [Actinoplanes sp. NBRC 101535]
MTMLRTRRIAAAVAACLTVAGLSACKSDPSVAAYLGDAGTVTEQRVQEVWDEAYDALRAQPRGATAGQSLAPEPVKVPFSRTDVVNALVSSEIYDRVAADRGATLPATLPFDEAAAQLGLPADLEYVRLYTRNAILRNQIEESVKDPATPSEDDLRDVYQRFAANGGLEPGMDFAAFRSSVPAEAMTALGSAITVRDAVVAEAQELDVTVNPRYQPLELGMYGINDSNSGRVYQIVAAALGADERTPVADVS